MQNIGFLFFLVIIFINQIFISNIKIFLCVIITSVLCFLLICIYAVSHAITGAGFNESSLYHILYGYSEVLQLTAYPEFNKSLLLLFASFLVSIFSFIYRKKYQKVIIFKHFGLLGQFSVLGGVFFIGIINNPVVFDIKSAVDQIGFFCMMK